MTESYFRKDIRWAKVSGRRGDWNAALGWKGELKARRVEKAHTKDLALIIARYWVDDQ